MNAERKPTYTNSRTSTTSDSLTGKRPLSFGNSNMDNTTYVLVFLVVLIPIIFTIILCTIIYCVHRHARKRSQRTPTDSPIAPIDRSGVTMIYNPQHSPFVFEELPPAYDSLSETKKDPRITTTNEEAAAAAIIRPTAPTPPPTYIDLVDPNK